MLIAALSRDVHCAISGVGVEQWGQLSQGEPVTLSAKGNRGVYPSLARGTDAHNETMCSHPVVCYVIDSGTAVRASLRVVSSSRPLTPRARDGKFSG